MKSVAQVLVASLVAIVGCGEPAQQGVTPDGAMTALDGGSAGAGGDGRPHDVLDCEAARDSFRSCRAAAPSCDALATALRACVAGADPAGEDDPPSRGRNDPPPPERGDDGTPSRGRRGDGASDGDGTGTRGDGSTRDGDRGDDGARRGDGDDDDAPDRCPPLAHSVPEACRPIAADYAACMHPCVGERRAAVRACVEDCRSSRHAAVACMQDTPACSSAWQGPRACLAAARQICADDADNGATEPSDACIEAIADCLGAADSCRTACGPLVQTARETCHAVRNLRPHRRAPRDHCDTDPATGTGCSGADNGAGGSEGGSGAGGSPDGSRRGQRGG